MSFRIVRSARNVPGRCIRTDHQDGSADTPRQPGPAVTKLELIGSVEWESVMPLLAAARDRTIEIENNSDGGNAYLVLALFEDLVMHPRQVMATLSIANSGAGIAAMGADHRRIAPGARVLMHKVRTT